MPGNSDFGFKILVGGIPLKEYQHADGPCFVECNLSTPVSYKQTTCELINGETESQVIFQFAACFLVTNIIGLCGI